MKRLVLPLTLAVLVTLCAGALAAPLANALRSPGTAQWTMQTTGTSQNLWDVQFLDDHSGWAVGSGGTIVHTGDGGTTWSEQPSGVHVPLYAVCFVNALSGWAVGGGNTILHTTDGGLTWSQQHGGDPADDYLSGVSFADLQHGWAVGDYSAILHTADGGASWKSQTATGTWDFSDVMFPDIATGWAVGSGVDPANPGGVGAILYTTDGGASWNTQDSGTKQPIAAIDMLNQSLGWVVGAGGTVLRYNGSTWEWHTLSSHESFEDVAFYDSVIGWAVGAPKGSPSGAGVIIYSTDGGHTWYDQNTTDKALHAIAVTPSGHAWIVGEGGAVYATDLGGPAQPSASPTASQGTISSVIPTPNRTSPAPVASAGKGNGTPWGFIIGLAAAGVVIGALAALLITRLMRRRGQQPPAGQPTPVGPPTLPSPTMPPPPAAWQPPGPRPLARPLGPIPPGPAADAAATSVLPPADAGSEAATRATTAAETSGEAPTSPATGPAAPPTGPAGPPAQEPDEPPTAPGA